MFETHHGAGIGGLEGSHADAGGVPTAADWRRIEGGLEMLMMGGASSFYSNIGKNSNEIRQKIYTYNFYKLINFFNSFANKVTIAKVNGGFKVFVDYAYTDFSSFNGTGENGDEIHYTTVVKSKEIFIESFKGDASYKQQQNGGRSGFENTNLILGGLGNSLGAQYAIMEYGVRTNFKSARTISQFNNLSPTEQSRRMMATYGNDGRTLMKGMNNFGRGLGYAQGLVIAGDILVNQQIKASHILDGIITGASFIPGWGWAIGGTYFLADLITRGITKQSIGQHLDNAEGGPLKEW